MDDLSSEDYIAQPAFEHDVTLVGLSQVNIRTNAQLIGPDSRHIRIPAGFPQVNSLNPAGIRIVIESG